MKYSLEQVKQWISKCGPEPIEPKDPCHFSLEKVHIGDRVVNLRGGDWVEQLNKVIKLSNRPTCQLFSGYSGTGKSSELLRLKIKLEAWGDMVLMGDIREYHDLEHPLSIEDMTIILAATFGDACQKLVGEDVIGENYWQRFLGFLNKELEIEEVSLKLKPIDFKVMVRNGTADFWKKVQGRLSTSLGRLKNDAHEFVQNCVEKVKKHSKKENVVFILDNLEKLGGSDLQFNENMRSLITVFSQHHDLLRLPGCHVIYSVPPSVGLQVTNIAQHFDWKRGKPLPAIPVTDRNRTELSPSSDGIEGLTQLIGKRIPLAKVFGEHLGLLEKLILYSGGHIRLLLAFVQELLVESAEEDFPVSAAVVDKLINDYVEDRTMAVRPEDVLILYKIHKAHNIKEIPREEVPILARFMDSQMVLCYRNGDSWFEVHPLIRKDVVARAEAALGAIEKCAKQAEKE